LSPSLKKLPIFGLRAASPSPLRYLMVKRLSLSLKMALYVPSLRALLPTLTLPLPPAAELWLALCCGWPAHLVGRWSSAVSRPQSPCCSSPPRAGETVPQPGKRTIN
jgi:hypothetical protein